MVVPPSIVGTLGKPSMIMGAPKRFHNLSRPIIAFLWCGILSKYQKKKREIFFQKFLIS